MQYIQNLPHTTDRARRFHHAQAHIARDEGRSAAVEHATLRIKTKEGALPEPNPKLKVALLAAARRQTELDDALPDLEDVLKEVAPNDPLSSDVFMLNERIDKILIDLADKYNVEIPDPQDQRTP